MTTIQRRSLLATVAGAFEASDATSEGFGLIFANFPRVGVHGRCSYGCGLPTSRCPLSCAMSRSVSSYGRHPPITASCRSFTSRCMLAPMPLAGGRSERCPMFRRVPPRPQRPRLDEVGGPGQPQRAQLLDHLDDLFACGHDVLARVDCLEHRRNLPHLGRWHVAEDVGVPVHCSVARRPRGRTSVALSASPRQASEMTRRTPLRPRSLRCLRNALHPFCLPWLPRRCRESVTSAARPDAIPAPATLPRLSRRGVPSGVHVRAATGYMDIRECLTARRRLCGMRSGAIRTTVTCPCSAAGRVKCFQHGRICSGCHHLHVDAFHSPSKTACHRP